MRTIERIALCIGVAASMAAPLLASDARQHHDLTQTPGGHVVVDGLEFANWQEYTQSDFFRNNGLRCGTPAELSGGVALRALDPSDCTLTFTNPSIIYAPFNAYYRIPVVVHVLRKDDGVTGHVSQSLIQSQIDILNEDFLALPGTYGENGTDVQIEFYLATEDPDGNPTNGITYSNNTTWYNDGGSYWNSLAWDPNRYMNVYTNTAGGNLGYVPNLPQSIAGAPSDRVVILWSAFGRDAPIGPPYDQGRTLTHEVGHYLGLYHPFDGCNAPGACFTQGDVICDTPPQDEPTFGCFDNFSCGDPDNILDYMDYSDDLCMEFFTSEQARRMRCSLENYRPLLLEAPCGNGVLEEWEQCDTAIPPPQPGSCPVNCDAGDPCLDGTIVDPFGCQRHCEYTPVTLPADGDGCCPPGANASNDNDCTAVCGNGVCEPGEETSCLTDCQCSVDDDCDDGYVCTIDRCPAGMCTYDPNLYGDVDHNGAVTLADLFCVLDGFQADFSTCSFEDDDVNPCVGNGVINLLDLFAVLDAFGGEDPCCGG